MKLKIKLNSVADAGLFVRTCSEFQEDIDVYYHRFILDGKSVMGILSMDLSEGCSVNINTDDENVKTKFKESMSLWIVKEDIL